MRKGGREEREIVAAFVLTTMAMIAHWPNQQRLRHSRSARGTQEECTREKANAKKSISGSSIYCYDNF
jgi:hypothetical protein